MRRKTLQQGKGECVCGWCRGHLGYTLSVSFQMGSLPLASTWSLSVRAAGASAPFITRGPTSLSLPPPVQPPKAQTWAVLSPVMLTLGRRWVEMHRPALLWYWSSLTRHPPGRNIWVGANPDLDLHQIYWNMLESGPPGEKTRPALVSIHGVD